MATSAADASSLSVGEARDIDTVRAIVSKALSGYPVRVFLFGSRSTGTHRRMSDIDVAVLHDGAVPADEFVRIRGLLEDSAVVRKVDLINLAEANPSLRERVLSEGVEWIA